MTEALTNQDKKQLGVSPDLWAALQTVAPEITTALDTVPGRNPSRFHAGKPGFKDWLLAEFALNVPDGVIVEKLKLVVAQQKDDRVKAADRWPEMNKQQVVAVRRDLASDWHPIRARLVDGIQQVGVASKNARIAALVENAEYIASIMYEERDEKNGRLYLLAEHRSLLHSIAEEMGELGSYESGNQDGLMEIARLLAGVVAVQGSGLQDKGDDDYDYRRVLDGEFADAETTVRD